MDTVLFVIFVLGKTGRTHEVVERTSFQGVMGDLVVYFFKTKKLKILERIYPAWPNAVPLENSRMLNKNFSSRTGMPP